MFDEEFKNNFEVRVPMFEDELRELFWEAKWIALEHFNSKAIGEVSHEYLEDLEMKFD